MLLDFEIDVTPDENLAEHAATDDAAMDFFIDTVGATVDNSGNTAAAAPAAAVVTAGMANNKKRAGETPANAGARKKSKRK